MFGCLFVKLSEYPDTKKSTIYFSPSWKWCCFINYVGICQILFPDALLKELPDIKTLISMRQTLIQLIPNLCDVSGTSNQLMDTHQISSDHSKGNTCILYTVNWIISLFKKFLLHMYFYLQKLYMYIIVLPMYGRKLSLLYMHV